MKLKTHRKGEHQLGRVPNDPRKARVELKELPGAAIQAPTSADWLSGLKSWTMSLNDKLGDCTCAGANHHAVQTQFYGQSITTTISDQDTLTMYSAISGYDPKSGRNDNGATLQDALNYWRKNGIGGYKLEAFAQLDPTNLNLVRACIAIFGGVYTGFNFPESAMDQFNKKQIWDVVSRTRMDGGHCVPLFAYDQSSFTCVTWGGVQKMTLNFYQRYFDEVWVPIDTAWLQVSGKSPSGLDVATLNADFQSLTGQAGPFVGVTPTPTPTPSPTPTPTPTPGSVPSDQDFWTYAKAWAAGQGLN